MRSIIGIGLLGTVLFLSGCVFLDGSFHQKGINSLSILKKDNPGLRRDCIAVMDQPQLTISVAVPDYVDATKLVPLIDWEGFGLDVNGVPLEHTVDFAAINSLRVTAKDGEVLEFRVEVTRVPAQTTKDLTLVALGNPYAGLYRPDSGSWDRWLLPEDNAVLQIKKTYGSDNLSYWYVYAESSGTEIAFDGLPFQNNSGGKDLTVAHTFTVTAEDGSSQDYRIRVQFQPILSAKLFAPPQTDVWAANPALVGPVGP